jgi:signal transduction histidine kinase/CheY-like chemotaxis protein
VNKSVNCEDEPAVLDLATQLLLEKHNFEYVGCYLVEDSGLKQVVTKTVQDFLYDRVTEHNQPWLAHCQNLAIEHLKTPEDRLLTRETQQSYYYSVSLRFETRQIGFLVVNSPSFDDNHSKFLPMFAGVLTSLLMNKRQQSYLTEDVQRRSQALESAWDYARQSDSAKTKFLSNVSHEYLTPLNLINNAGSLLMDTELSPEQSQSVVTILDAVQKLTTMVGGTIDYAQSQSSTFSSVKHQVSLAKLIREVAAEFAQPLALSGVDLQLKIADIPAVDADEQRLKFILNHLLSNAVKFTHDGVIEVELKFIEQKGQIAVVEFRVTDTGIGIAPSDQAVIFNAYHQLSSVTSDSLSNTGLGLALCQRLAGSLGSEIIVSSALGEGSTFHFCLDLPLTEIVDNKDRLDENPELVSVLLVEDNLVNQKLAARLLEKIGCQVDVANDGIDAVEKFSQRHYDMVFMDCQMPNMDGFEAASKIRELESDHRTPIIALTANSLPEDRARSFRVGMDEFITKPVAREKLQKAIQRWGRQA